MMKIRKHGNYDEHDHHSMLVYMSLLSSVTQCISYLADSSGGEKAVLSNQRLRRAAAYSGSG